MRNRCYPSHLHYFIRACERAYKQQIIMKRYFTFLFLVLNLWCSSNLHSQTPINCIADLTFVVQSEDSLVLYPEDFIEGIVANYDYYILDIKDANETLVPNNTLLLGLYEGPFTATVTDLLTQNSCWATFDIIAAQQNDVNAKCKSSINKLVGFSGNVTINPLLLDNGSENYLSLFLKRNAFDCSKSSYRTRLYAQDANNLVSVCDCTLNIVDEVGPISVVESEVNMEMTNGQFIDLTPEMFDNGSTDNCQIASYEINPKRITCTSPNPSVITFEVTDVSGNKNTAWSNFSYILPSVQTSLICQEELTIYVNPFQPQPITSPMVLIGYYGCTPDFDLTLTYNGINKNIPQVSWEDAGKTFLCKVTDNETGNTCEIDIIVTKIIDCSTTFVVCDTKCPDGNPDDCESGYTNSDNIDWPCGFDIYVCAGASADQLSPENLETVYGVPSQNVRPQIINYDCPSIFMVYSDVELGIGSPNSQNKRIYRKWDVLDWLDGNLYGYTQIFNVFADGIAICDTLPWNTPFGNCASGHTDTDAIEWPADITVSDALISLSALRSNPNVHPNDVEPRLIEYCSSAYEITFYDIATTIDDDTKMIERRWEAFNWVTSTNSFYVQHILHTGNQVCVYTQRGEPLSDVVLGQTNTGESGCVTVPLSINGASYEIEPDKTGNAIDGVDFMDWVTIQEAILGGTKLNFYQQIAADINNDGAITSSDLTELRKMLDGLITTWQNNRVWNFIDKQRLDDLGEYVEVINTENLLYSNEFIGVKTGDVNDSYGNNPSYTVIKVDDIATNSGENYEVSFNSDRFQNLVALNLEFDIKDSGITINEVTSALLPNFDQNQHVTVTDDKIVIKWVINLGTTPQGVSLRNSDPLFKFSFKANKNSVLSSILELNPEVHNAIKQSGSTDAATVNLYWDSKIINGIAENPLSHLKVQPNPFYDYIQIVGLTTDANYEVSDASGRTLISGLVNADGIVDLHALNNGFYILKLSQNDRVNVTHKIIKLK